MTDGFAVSIQLLKNDMIEKQQQKKDNLKKARQVARELYDDLNDDEIYELKEQKKKEALEKKIRDKIQHAEKRKAMREEFKKLPKDEQKRINAEISAAKLKIGEEKCIEFPYLEDLNDKEYEELQNENWVVTDPGRRVPMYMRNKKGVTLRYSNGKHLHVTRRLKYQKTLENYKKRVGIVEIEKELSMYNSKSCVYETFKAYVKKKNELNKRLIQEYKAEIFRQYKWYGYINREKAHAKLANEIAETYGEDVIIIHGDWSTGKQMKGTISTPGIGLKRRLARRFKVYNIDEHKTSCINYKTKERSKNLWL